MGELLNALNSADADIPPERSETDKSAGQKAAEAVQTASQTD